MKKLAHILGYAFAFALILQACQNDNAADSSKLATEEAIGQPGATPAAPTDPTAAPAATNEPPQNASGVWHYTCPKGCSGGAGAASPCAQCGTTLVHNQTYHGAGQPAAAPATNPTAGTAAAAPATKQEPPQNAKGVWHYTCPKGCAGGSGAASACPQCGTTMTHNTIYHQ
ncbi:MAG: hypothetical protein IT261_10555 [Saprospiraceae bacterium]|nr:hypothetical protein [Saprospiraceae bacterium]